MFTKPIFTLYLAAIALAAPPRPDVTQRHLPGTSAENPCPFEYNLNQSNPRRD